MSILRLFKGSKRKAWSIADRQTRKARRSGFMWNGFRQTFSSGKAKRRIF